MPVLVALYRRDGWLPLTTMFAVYASILYAAGLVCFTLYPLPTGDAGPGITYGVPPIPDPLNFIHDIAEGGVRAVFQLLLNIVLLMPFGFIARILLKLKLPLALTLSLAVFYFFAREMPYDHVPEGWAKRVGDGEEAPEMPKASRA